MHEAPAAGRRLLSLAGREGEALRIEPAARGALVHLRRASDGAYLSAGNQGGAVGWSDQARAWEAFLPLYEETLGAVLALGRRPMLRFGDPGPLPAGSIGFAPGHRLRLGGSTLSILDGLSATTLGDDRSGRVLLAIGGASPPRHVVLSRFEPAVLWRSDGSDAAEEEIALGTDTLRGPGGHGGIVLGPGRDAAEALDTLAGPLLVLANGVFCRAPIAPLLAAAAFAPGLLARPWRRNGTDPFGPDGPAAGDGLPDHRSAIAIDPAVVASGGGERERVLLARLLARPGEPDGPLADAVRLLSRATGAPLEAAALDRFVTVVGPDDDVRTAAALVDPRDLSAGRRLAMMRDALGGEPGAPLGAPLAPPR